MYSVVHFLNENEVDVVPNDWIVKNAGQIFTKWPKLRSSVKINQAVARNFTLKEGEFQLFQIRIFKSYSSLELARRHLKTAEVDSDLNSEAEEAPQLKRIVIPKRMFGADSSDDETATTSTKRPKLTSRPSISDHTTTLLPPSLGVSVAEHDIVMLPPPPPEASAASTEKRRPHLVAVEHSNATAQRNEISEDVTNQLSENPGTSLQLQTAVASQAGNGSSSRKPDCVMTDEKTTKVTCNSEFEKWVLRNCGIMKAQLKQIQETLDAILQGQSSDSTTTVTVQDQDNPGSDVCGALPLKDASELLALEDKIKDLKLRKILVRKLSLRGGQDARDCARRILSAMITDDFAVTFSWLGSRGDKSAFKKTIMRDILHDAVRKCKKFATADDQDLDITTNNWLKNAKKRKNLKCSSTSTTVTDDEVDLNE